MKNNPCSYRTTHGESGLHCRHELEVNLIWWSPGPYNLYILLIWILLYDATWPFFFFSENIYAVVK